MSNKKEDEYLEFNFQKLKFTMIIVIETD